MDQKSAVGYCGPMTRPATRVHPELSDKDSDTADPTVAGLANDVAAQITDATERVYRILGRLNGPGPDGGEKTMGPAAGILGTLHIGRDRAGKLLRMLDELESRIGG